MREPHEMSGPEKQLEGSGSNFENEQLLPLVYEQLRRLATVHLARESPGQTLQPTALVHEAYVRLAETSGGQAWDHPGHFFAAAAESMRRILVESARRKQTIKRGGKLQRVDVDVETLPEPDPFDDILALDEALTRLMATSPAAARVVKLRYFAGLTSEETAEALGISDATARRHWTYARAWLYRVISLPNDHPEQVRRNRNQ